MKYMVMLTRGEWEASAPPAEQERIFAEIGAWWGRHVEEGTIVEGHQLQPPETATTVVLGSGGNSTLIDGPFMEAKEAIGGYAIVDVADLDEAIAVFRTFPSPSSKAEIRPVVQR